MDTDLMTFLKHKLKNFILDVEVKYQIGISVCYGKWGRLLSPSEARNHYDTVLKAMKSSVASWHLPDTHTRIEYPGEMSHFMTLNKVTHCFQKYTQEWKSSLNWLFEIKVYGSHNDIKASPCSLQLQIHTGLQSGEFPLCRSTWTEFSSSKTTARKSMENT